MGHLKISEDPWNFKGKGPQDLLIFCLISTHSYDIPLIILLDMIHIINHKMTYLYQCVQCYQCMYGRYKTCGIICEVNKRNESYVGNIDFEIHPIIIV